MLSSAVPATPEIRQRNGLWFVIGGILVVLLLGGIALRAMSDSRAHAPISQNGLPSTTPLPRAIQSAPTAAQLLAAQEPTRAAPQLPTNRPVAPSAGWSYALNQLSPAHEIALPPGNTAGIRPGNRLIALMVPVINNTGLAQPIPPRLFELRDNASQVFQARPIVSKEVASHANDHPLSMLDPVPADRQYHQVLFVFDIPPGVLRPVLFDPDQPDQAQSVNLQ